MSCKFICDGCGKRSSGQSVNGRWLKPESWYEQFNEDNTQIACSKDCIRKIEKKIGKPNITFIIKE